MKFYSILLFFTLLFQSLNGQTKTVTVKTDSSVIKIHYSNGKKKWSDEFYNEKNLVHEIDYQDNDSTAIACERYLDKSLAFSSIRGVSKSYSEDHTLDWIIDYDKRILIYVDTLKYPNYNLLSKMKEKGDSIIKNIYGNSFFNEHIKWDIGSSYYFDKNYYSEPSFSMEWLRCGTKNKYKATEFNIRYDIFYDSQKLEDAIEIIIDKNGTLLPSHLWNESWTIYNQGLEKSNLSDRDFNLTNNEAIKLATKFGLQLDDSSKIWSELRWKPVKDSTAAIFNGHFTISVFQELPDTLSKNKKQHGIYVRHYKVWIFNPWTKEFVGLKRMHRDYNTERDFMGVGDMTDD